MLPEAAKGPFRSAGRYPGLGQCRYAAGLVAGLLRFRAGFPGLGPVGYGRVQEVSDRRAGIRFRWRCGSARQLPPPPPPLPASRLAPLRQEGRIHVGWCRVGGVPIIHSCTGRTIEAVYGAHQVSLTLVAWLSSSERSRGGPCAGGHGLVFLLLFSVLAKYVSYYLIVQRLSSPFRRPSKFGSWVRLGACC